jgi:hypothetical protein
MSHKNSDNEAILRKTGGPNRNTQIILKRNKSRQPEVIMCLTWVYPLPNFNTANMPCLKGWGIVFVSLYKSWLERTGKHTRGNSLFNLYSALLHLEQKGLIVIILVGKISFNKCLSFHTSPRPRWGFRSTLFSGVWISLSSGVFYHLISLRRGWKGKTSDFDL